MCHSEFYLEYSKQLHPTPVAMTIETKRARPKSRHRKYSENEDSETIIEAFVRENLKTK